MKPGGWAILNVPVTAEKSVDHPHRPGHLRHSLDRRPAEHLRTYGHDFEQRMASVGFLMHVIRPGDMVAAGDQARFGIAGAAAGAIFMGMKPP